MKRHYLSPADSFKVMSWLQNEAMCGHITHKDSSASLAAKVSESLKLEVKPTNMYTLMKALEIKIPIAPKLEKKVNMTIEELQVRVTALEQEMKALKASLGI